MTEARLLGQFLLPAGAETVLLTVPNNSKAYIQGFTFCNQVAAGRTFRLSFSKLGQATATKDYIYYDLPLSGNNTFLSNLEVTLDGTDVIRAYSLLGNVSVELYGRLT